MMNNYNTFVTGKKLNKLGYKLYYMGNIFRIFKIGRIFKFCNVYRRMLIRSKRTVKHINIIFLLQLFQFCKH